MITPSQPRRSGGDAPRRFDGYAPRRVNVVRRGYSIFVRIMKVALPLTALVIIGVLIAHLSDNDTPQKNVATLPTAEKTTPGLIELIQPKYQDVDADGSPYTVTADKAMRAVDTPDMVLFTNPVADITLKDKTWLAAKAATGTFDRKSDTLELKDNVDIFHDSGYELRTQDIVINMKQKTAYTARHVVAQGPAGTLAARNMSVLNHGDLIIFGGPARLTVFSRANRKARG
ncbi:MAG: LPS export ABC transporter periplasmic protein LptC [Alphaproteobacteria bacterium]|nr:LPS export ABC transporter periplasmic protein LptC [Alphaproteobacteria bacterium]MDE2335798.1 LPS export ABC transporter periplasmic protein LptC [Alphaproteobacteria bacterium]